MSGLLDLREEGMVRKIDKILIRLCLKYRSTYGIRLWCWKDEVTKARNEILALVKPKKGGKRVLLE